MCGQESLKFNMPRIGQLLRKRQRKKTVGEWQGWEEASEDVGVPIFSHEGCHGTDCTTSAGFFPLPQKNVDLSLCLSSPVAAEPPLGEQREGCWSYWEAPSICKD